MDLDKFNGWLSENIDGFSQEISALRMALSKSLADEVSTFDRKKLNSVSSANNDEEDSFGDYIAQIRKSVVSEVAQFSAGNLSPRKTIVKERIHIRIKQFLYEINENPRTIKGFCDIPPRFVGPSAAPRLNNDFH